MRRKYIWDPDTREFIEIEKYQPKVTTQIITDSMPDRLWHPCDGNYYDSKSRFREVTKAHGGIEVGNESQKCVESNRFQFNRDERKQDIAAAIRELKGRTN